MQIQHEYESRTQKINQQTIMNYTYKVEYLVTNNISLSNITILDLQSAYNVLPKTIELFGDVDRASYNDIAKNTY